MKLRWIFALIFALGVTPVAAATPQEQLTELKTSIGWIDFVLDRAKQGDVLLVQSGDNGTSIAFPGNRQYYVWRVRNMVAKGRLTAKEGATALLAVAHQTARLRRELEIERDGLIKQKAELERAISKPRPPLQPYEMGRPPAPPRPPAKASGPSLAGANDTWKFDCCDDKYHTTVTLSFEAGHVEGSFEDGSAVSGTYKGDDVRFHRTMGGGGQDYHMTLSADGRTMEGSFTGTRDTTVGVKTTMRR
ncbi:MAG: hypothetical protein WDN08_15410 [Rhizomicrobium sp.]